MINIAGIIYYICSLVIDIECARYKNAFNKLLNELCVKITLPRSILNKCYRGWGCNAVYLRLCIGLIHINPLVTAEGFDVSHHPTYAEHSRLPVRYVTNVANGRTHLVDTVPVDKFLALSKLKTFADKNF